MNKYENIEICDRNCMYKRKDNTCIGRSEKGVMRARRKNRCQLFNDGSKKNNTKCEKK